jgi:hypothetical protein
MIGRRSRRFIWGGKRASKVGLCVAVSARTHAPACGMRTDRRSKEEAVGAVDRAKRGQGLGSETIGSRRLPYSCSLKPTES